MEPFSLRLSKALKSRLDDEAQRKSIGPSEVVRTALTEYLNRKEHERYIAAFVAEARAAYADPEIRLAAMAVSEEALQFDNEHR
jgi:predicted transcriptional regulator